MLWIPTTSMRSCTNLRIKRLPYNGFRAGNVRHSSSSTGSEKTTLTSSADFESHHDLWLDELRQKRFITTDFLSLQSKILLDAALEGHMPERSHQIADTHMQLGYHQVYFRPRLTPSQLLFDGTDTKFLPGVADIWQYRLWAGGSVTFNHSQPLVYNATQEAVQVESVEDIRVTGKNAPEKVFVKVKKAISLVNTFDGESSEHSTMQLFSSQPPLEEQYTLCFLRQSLTASPDRAAIKLPANPMFSHTMVPDLNLLFQFSAMTHNAHKIHFDEQFATEEYGLQDCVVHGPLTQVLLIDFLQKSLDTLSQHQHDVRRVPMHMDYSNFRPLYAGEKITICCSPARSHADDPLQAPMWQVWIQTGSSSDASLAVRGTIRISAINN